MVVDQEMFQWIIVIVQLLLLDWVRIHALQPSILLKSRGFKRPACSSLYGGRSDSTHDETDKSRHKMIVPNGVTLKIALDMNHGVADASLERSERFTCSSSLDLVHRLRKCSHVVLVGRRTVEQDNCTLTVRRVSPLQVETHVDGVTFQKAVQPTRVIIDPWLKLVQSRLEQQYAIFKDGYETIVYHGLTDDELLVDKIKSQILAIKENVQVVKVAIKDDDDVGKTWGMSHPKSISPRQIMADLNSRGKMHIMVEGGPATARIFLQDGLVDRAIIIRAPLYFKEPIPSGITYESLEKAGLVLLGTKLCGVDNVEYWSKDGLAWPSSSLESWP